MHFRLWMDSQGTAARRAKTATMNQMALLERMCSTIMPRRGIVKASLPMKLILLKVTSCDMLFASPCMTTGSVEVSTEDVFSLQGDGEKLSVIKETLAKAIHAAGVIHGEYNIEMYFTNADESFIIEINPRQGGNGIPKYVHKHTGIDLYKLLVTTSVGDDYYWNSLKELKRQNRPIIHHLLFPRKTGRFLGLSFDDSILGCVFNTEVDKIIGDAVTNAIDASSCIGCVDLQFGSVEEMNKVSLDIEELIRVEVDENCTDNRGDG